MFSSFYVNNQAVIPKFEASSKRHDCKSATNSQGCHKQKKLNDHEHMILCGIILSPCGIAVHTPKKVDSRIVFEDQYKFHIHTCYHLSTNA